MKGLGNIISTLFVLLVIGLIGAGLYRGGEYIWGLLSGLEGRQVPVGYIVSLSVVFGALIITAGLRSALKRREDPGRYARKADVYGHMLEAWTEGVRLNGGKSNAGSDGKEGSQHALNGDAILLVGNNVLKEYIVLQKLVRKYGIHDRKVRSQFKRMLLEMRRDLGENTWGLSRNALLHLLPGYVEARESAMNETLVGDPS
jgi:hypothetical protein